MIKLGTTYTTFTQGKHNGGWVMMDEATLTGARIKLRCISCSNRFFIPLWKVGSHPEIVLSSVICPHCNWHGIPMLKGIRKEKERQMAHWGYR